MANQTNNTSIDDVGGHPYDHIDLPVAASTHLYAGGLLAQLTSGGALVPYSTASSEHCVGVGTHEADNSAVATDGAKRMRVMTNCVLRIANGTSTDAFAETDIIGAPVYGTDDHTAAKTSNSNARKMVGFFDGLEADGKVRVRIVPTLSRLYAQLAALTDSPASADALRDNIVAKVAT